LAGIFPREKTKLLGIFFPVTGSTVGCSCGCFSFFITKGFLNPGLFFLCFIQEEDTASYENGNDIQNEKKERRKREAETLPLFKVLRRRKGLGLKEKEKHCTKVLEYN